MSNRSKEFSAGNVVDISCTSGGQRNTAVSKCHCDIGVLSVVKTNLKNGLRISVIRVTISIYLI